MAHQDVLARLLLLFEYQVHKGPEDGPHLRFTEGNLRGKVLGTVKLRGQNGVLRGDIGRGARTKTNFHLVGTRQ